MKCDELKAYNVVVTDECADYICGQQQLSFEAYAAEDVDVAIEELKDENRRLKRALWLARADRAMAEPYSVLNDVMTSNRWVKALNKLKAKSEEYYK